MNDPKRRVPDDLIAQAMLDAELRTDRHGFETSAVPFSWWHRMLLFFERIIYKSRS